MWLEEYMKKGFRFFAYGTDMIFMLEKIRQEMANINKVRNNT